LDRTSLTIPIVASRITAREEENTDDASDNGIYRKYS
jgi:hypothetical protein